jgi:hypothetical protein
VDETLLSKDTVGDVLGLEPSDGACRKTARNMTKSMDSGVELPIHPVSQGGMIQKSPVDDPCRQLTLRLAVLLDFPIVRHGNPLKYRRRWIPSTLAKEGAARKACID